MSKSEIMGGLLGVAIAGIPGVGITALMGFQLGAAVAGMLFPPDMPSIEQGRLSDIRGSGSSHGVTIPKIYGRERVGCIIVFASDVRESTGNDGGGNDVGSGTTGGGLGSGDSWGGGGTKFG